MDKEPTVIEYVATPTGREFHADPSWVRGVMGPFGSGKSSMCVWEIFARAKGARPHGGVRCSRWAIIRNCFDDQTEILTEHRGWVLFRDLREDDRVASLVNDTDLQFVQPTYYYRAPYQGEMIGIRGEQFDFLTTPDHKHYVRRRFSRKRIWLSPELVKAQDFYGIGGLYRMKRDALWRGGESEYARDVYEFLGFWFAEGSCATNRPTPAIILTQTTPDGIAYTKDLLDRCGLPYTTNRRTNGGFNFRISTVSPADHASSTKTLAQELIPMLLKAGHATTKAVPSAIRNASADCCASFLFGFMQGDGGLASNEKTMVGSTSSKQLADDLQEIALRAGLVANVRSKNQGRIREGKTAPEWTVSLIGDSKYSPVVQRKHWYRQKYDGMVYCVEVPSHVVYVRRNGVAAWCSQTYHDLHDTTLRTFLDWIPEGSFEGYSLRLVKTHPMHAYLRMALDDGTRVEAEFIFLALDREDDVATMDSMELTGAWINEARHIPFAIFRVARGRTRRFPPKKDGGWNWSGLIMDTNPPEEEHWWYNLAEIECPKNHRFWKQPPAILEVPAAKKGDPPTWVPNYGQSPDYAAAENVDGQTAGFRYWLDQTGGVTKEWIRVFLQGFYGSVMEGKPVYQEYNDDLHRVNFNIEPMRGLPLYLGWDFGVTPSVIFAQLTPNGCLNVIDEICAEDMGIKQFVPTTVRPYVLNHYHGMEIISTGDPAGRQRQQVNAEMTCIQELAANGFPTQPAITNDFLTRREAVAGFLVRNAGNTRAFQLSNRCRILRKGFQKKYIYGKRRTSIGESHTPEPLKLHPWSDAQDALQYIALRAQGGGLRATGTGSANRATGGRQAKRPVRKRSWKGAV